jgi:small-conductance mechanosensitive channel/CRP-like cAMP-binding protein
MGSFAGQSEGRFAPYGPYRSDGEQDRGQAIPACYHGVLKDGTPLIAGLVLLVATFALRGATVNRHIRGKLLISCAAFAAYTAADALSTFAPMSATLRREIDVVAPLLLAFGAVNAIVALLVNPWRADRIPENFPKIVQDALVIALFAVAATLFLQDKVLATTAAGAVILGLALQDTLGNLFAGLAIQIEKPFRVGHWVTVGGKDGLVSEITWRATKIRTKAGNFVIVPNSALARDTITNYSEPTLETRVEVEVGASYDTPPSDVKAAIRDALREEPIILQERHPEILLVDFAASAIVYRVRVWTNDFAADELVRDRVRTRVYYAFRRLGIVIPYPIQTQIKQQPAPARPENRLAQAETLAAVDILASLSDEQRRELADSSRSALYAAGEAIIHEGDGASSMFVVSRGEASVRLAEADGEVARLHAGAFFGEMSLLTGEPRSATVIAATDCELLEIGADAFRRVVLADPAVVEQITSAVTARRSGLETHRATKTARSAEIEAPHTFLARVRQFLRLGS